MGIMSRLAGDGFGSKWGVPWLPEALFCLPIALAPAYAVYSHYGLLEAVIPFLLSWVISYAGMQSGTWMFLRWESHDDPNTERGSTLKPIMDWIARKLGYKLGQEGFAWIAAAVKGFIIFLPVGGFIGAVMWPLGYELGSHAKGRVEKYGLDPHMFSEFFAGFLGSVVVLLFLGAFL